MLSFNPIQVGRVHVIYPPSVTWSDKWQRPHYLLKHLADNGFIVHFIPWKIDDSKKSDFAEKAKIEYCKNFFVYRDYTAFVRESGINHDDKVIIHATSPDALKYSGQIQHDYFWFDYLDDYEEWQKDLKACFDKADIITCSGVKLFNKAQEMTGKKDIILVENGVDYEKYSRSVEPLPCKYFDGKEKKFTIGFIGALCKEIDYNLINYVITQFDFARFVFIGNEIDGNKFSEKIKPFRGNVEYLGVLSDDDVISCLSHIDVGIVLYDRDYHRVDYINSIKTYVYLAAGKRVVCSSLPDISRYDGVVDIVDNHDKTGFLKKLIEVYREKPSDDYIKKAQSIAISHDWGVLGETVLTELKSRFNLQVEKEVLPAKKHVIYPMVISWDGKRQRPHHLLKHLAGLGWHAHFIAFRTRENFDKMESGKVFYPADGNGMAVYPDAKTFADVAEIQPQDHVVIYASYPPALDGGEKLKESFRARNKHFHYNSRWYDFLDDFPQRRAQEPGAISSADFVSASAKKLMDIAGEIRDDVVYVPNGGEFEHFHQAEKVLPCGEMERIKKGNPEKKIVGFFGYIAPWFDKGLLKKIFELLPDCLFVFLGDSYGTDNSGQVQADNALYLGAKHYNDLPAYLSHFDCCIIPFDMSQEVIHATNPCKIWEYLASGKPVVCTDMPEIRNMTDNKAIYIGKTPEEFVSCVKKALAEKGKIQTKLIGIRQEIAQNNDWSARAKEIDDLINPEAKKKVFFSTINFKPVGKPLKIFCPSRKYAVRDLAEALKRTDGVEAMWASDIHGRENIGEISRRMESYLESYKPDVVLWEGMCINKAPQESLFQLMAKLRKKYGFRLVYWSTEDPPHHNEVGRPRAEISDYVFATADEFVQIYNDMGKPASHLMFGANPWEHIPRPVEKQYACDILFIGTNYAHHPLRREGFNMMFRPLVSSQDFQWKKPFRIYGLWWGCDSPWNTDIKVPYPIWRGCISRREISWAYSGAKVSLGIMIDNTSPTHLPFRPFEALACGSLHISQWNPAIENVFGNKIETVKTQEEFLAKLNFYMSKPEARKKQAEIGREFVMANHTYVHRANQVLSDLRKAEII